MAQTKVPHDFSSLIVALANLGATISCPATARRALSCAIEKNWFYPAEIIIKELKRLRQVGETALDLCIFALKPEVSVQKFEKYFDFVLSREMLTIKKMENLISEAMSVWKTAPSNVIYKDKFVFLIKKTNANINQMKIGRYTAIDWAIRHHHTLMVDALMALGAEPAINDEKRKPY